MVFKIKFSFGKFLKILGHPVDGLHASSFLSPASDYGRSGVASDLYEGTSTLTSKYVNEGQANSITSAMIVDGTVTSADIQDGTIQTVDCAFTVGDITAVNAGAGLGGGGTSGSVTLYVPTGAITSDMIQNYTITGVDISTPIMLSGSSSGAIVQGVNTGSGEGVRGVSAGVGVNGASTSSVGVRAEGPSYALRAYASNTSGTRFAGDFYCAGTAGYAYVGGTSGGVNYKILGSGSVSCIMPTREGEKILFAPECPEPYFEDFGHGQLSNGYCRIELDPLFLDCIKTDANHPMKVFIQLNDECNGVYVKVGTTGFDVYELQNGKSNAKFTYRVVANRKDIDYLRFPQARELIHAQPLIHAEPKKIE